MSGRKTCDDGSYRDLTGRRLNTIREAKKLAEDIESEPVRKKAGREPPEKKLGISKDGESSKKKKRRLDDDECVEQSKIVESVKNAVSAALVKKKKKAEVSHSSSKPADTPSPPSASTNKALPKAVETKPITAPSLATAGA